MKDHVSGFHLVSGTRISSLRSHDAMDRSAEWPGPNVVLGGDTPDAAEVRPSTRTTSFRKALGRHVIAQCADQPRASSAKDIPKSHKQFDHTTCNMMTEHVTALNDAVMELQAVVLEYEWL